MKPGAVPEVMSNPLLLTPGDTWRHECPESKCNMVLQGGREGLAAHIITVHRPWMPTEDPENIDGPSWEWYHERKLNDEEFHVKLLPAPDVSELCKSDCGYGPNISRCRAGHIEFTRAKARTNCPHKDTEGKRCGKSANVFAYGP
jgi:hypothetical protein